MPTQQLNEPLAEVPMQMSERRADETFEAARLMSSSLRAGDLAEVDTPWWLELQPRASDIDVDWTA